MTSGDVSSWLAEAERLFRSMARGKRLRIIIVPEDESDIAKGIELRTGGRIADQRVTLSEVRARDMTQPARVHVQLPQGFPVIAPVELAELEARILQTLITDGGRLQGPEIARALGRAYDGTVRRVLAAMRRKRHLLDWASEEGYGIVLIGRMSYEAWKANQED